jgi:hypothetical protein
MEYLEFCQRVRIGEMARPVNRPYYWRPNQSPQFITGPPVEIFFQVLAP